MFYCQGGHGRTGTALAIIGALSNCIPPGVDPVAEVRRRYCDLAVESAAQIEYIEAITGREVKAPVVQKPPTVPLTGAKSTPIRFSPHIFDPDSVGVDDVGNVYYYDEQGNVKVKEFNR